MATGVVDSALSDTVVKLSGAGNVLYIAGHSGDGSVRYIQVFDAFEAADVTLGSTLPSFVFPLPAGPSAVHTGEGFRCNRGVCVACTTLPTNAVAPTFAATCSMIVGE